MRDFEKMINEGRQALDAHSKHYDMTAEEMINELTKASQNDIMVLYKSLMRVYEAGTCAGIRMAKADARMLRNN